MNLGFTTQTGPPSSWAAATASSTLKAGFPLGTGHAESAQHLFSLIFVDIHGVLDPEIGGESGDNSRAKVPVHAADGPNGTAGSLPGRQRLCRFGNRAPNAALPRWHGFRCVPSQTPRPFRYEHRGNKGLAWP